jgi:hypothetical protein
MPPVTCARALAPRGAFVTRRGDRAAARQRGAASWALVFDTAPHASARGAFPFVLGGGDNELSF